MIAKDYTERLSAVALSVGLISPCGKCVSGHVVQVSSLPKYLDRDCVERRQWWYRPLKMATTVYEREIGDAVQGLRTASLP